MRALGGCGGASGGVAGTGTSRVRNAGLLRTGQYPAGASTQPSAAAFAPNKALCRAILPPPPPPCPLTRGAGRRAPGTVALASSNGVDIGVEGYIQVSQESPPTREKYAREVGEMYGKRAAKYDHGDNGRWHTNTSLELVRAAGLKRGQVVLDVGTGTGITAFHAATFVGDSGHVLGVDISEGMLEVANAKLLAAGEAMRWVVTFRLGDCENPSAMGLKGESFNAIICGHALPWFNDIPLVFEKWSDLLRPGGRLAVHGHPHTSFVAGYVLIEAAKEHGISFSFHKEMGEERTIRATLAGAA